MGNKIKPDSDNNNQDQDKKTNTTEPVPTHVRTRRFWQLLGSNPNSYCVECGGVCGNSNHEWGKRRF